MKKDTRKQSWLKGNKLVYSNKKETITGKDALHSQHLITTNQSTFQIQRYSKIRTNDKKQLTKQSYSNRNKIFTTFQYMLRDNAKCTYEQTAFMQANWAITVSNATAGCI